MNQTKLVHLTTGHTPFDIRVFGRECRTLAQYGYEVTLVVPCSGQIPERVDGVRFDVIPQPSRRLARMTVAVWRAFCKALREQGDLYHFHDTELMLAGLGLRALGKRVVYDVHEDVPEQIRYSLWIPEKLRRPVAWLYIRFERFSSRRFTALVAANSEIYARICSYNDQVTLLHNYPLSETLPYVDEIYASDRLTESTIRSTGAPPRQYARSSTGQEQQSDALIANFGGISPQTCAGPIVEAMGLIPAELKPVLIIGGRIISRSLLDHVSHLPGWGRVVHRGRIQRTEMMHDLRRAAAALVLYSPDPNHMGVGSNRLFECMSAGIPVITPNFPRWRAIVEKFGCGLVVDPLNPQQIAAAITHILSHPLEARDMGIRGREAVRTKFNWDTEKHKLLELYDRPLRSTPSLAGNTLPQT